MHSAAATSPATDEPVIRATAVNGFALGGGTEISLACDFIYASEKAKFGLPEITLGIIPGFGGTQRLSRLIGKNIAKELIFTGKMIDAQEAKSIGIVNAVFPHDELMDNVLKTAKTMAAWNGRKEVTIEDVNQALELALPHRLLHPPALNDLE